MKMAQRTLYVITVLATTVLVAASALAEDKRVDDLRLQLHAEVTGGGQAAHDAAQE